MGSLIIIPALILAFLVLRGWPAEWGMELRALVALASLGAGLWPMTWHLADRHTPRFQPARAPDVLQRLTGASVLAVSLAMIYLALVFGPGASLKICQVFHQTEQTPASSSEGAGQGTNGAGNGENGGTGGRGVQTKLSTVFDREGVPIPKSVNLSPTEKPEVRLEFATVEEAGRLHSAGPVYLTSFSHNYFDGERWTSQGATGTGNIMASDPDGLVFLPDAKNQLPAYRYTVLHGSRYDGMNTLLTLHGPHYVRYRELLHPDTGVFLLPALHPSIPNYEYEAGSTPQRLEDFIAQSVPIEPGTIAAIYRAPTSHPALKLQVQGLAANFDRELPLAERLSHMRDWLRQNYAYSPVVNAAPNGKSTMENFLGEPGRGTGICIHFATAGTLLARELGVPSRLSFGWSGGKYYGPHRQFVFRGDHSHAWTEIYLKDHGWVIFDVTPPAALPQEVVAKNGEAPPSVEAFLEDESGEETQTSLTDRLLHSGWTVILCGAGLVTLLIACFLRFLKLKAAMAGSPFAAVTAPLGYWRLFQQACVQHGHPIPAGRTLWQHLEVLRGQQVPLDFADELLAYHYGVTYRNQPRDAQAEKRLSQKIRTWTPAASCKL